MEKLRLGLIGCGGRAGAHMNSFLQMDDVAVVAVADPREDRRNAAAAKFGCTRIYTDHRDLYAHENRSTLDAVVIAIEPTAHIGVEETARQAGVRRSCLYRAFQEEFGCSPSAYLTRYRIQRACQLLRHSTLPVSAVAASVGFEDPFYFSRAFRREVGCSPTAYREHEQSGT